MNTKIKLIFLLDRAVFRGSGSQRCLSHRICLTMLPPPPPVCLEKLCHLGLEVQFAKRLMALYDSTI